ncbi:alpha-N-arabinofuranosidase [Jiangella ureilytica]|uniref:non-reducing end alpha-L-arabinofuranosidase n=1 Tax=Jiangella ureilytica TaxID=2530374 RepID=A0A4V2XW68_9ACTN|nr:alpha-N-arabinofuranosidase [Jiangella ureilytica]TDC48035.1 alpha-N-arabinofuranosidase [Jiangella ureilytica]
MIQADFTLSPERRIAPVNRRTFGSFVEHLGRCVYTGIYEPGHPAADESGFRRDVLELVRELGVTTVRYPGGNFVSGYRWEDGVGPRDQRPARLDLAWHTLEPNDVGTDEFLRWAERAGIEPMMAVNLGTRGVQDAVDLLEYVNGTAASALADLRRANGHPEPYGVRMWCLGNEMDGPWQLGHKTAYEYGRIAAETARAMRAVDPGLELVACGSSASDMPTFGEWERAVLTEAYDLVDYVSLHRYYEEHDQDLASFLASVTDLDHFIDAVVATIDHVGAVKRSNHRVNLSFDEWNVWYQSRAESVVPAGDDWPVAPPLLEDRYSVADAVVVGNILISLLRHSDRVTAASQAQLVNVIAPIMTKPGGEAWRQTIFHPFAQASRLARGEVLRLDAAGPPFATAKYGDVAPVDAVATWDRATESAAVFLVNRHPAEEAVVSIDMRPLGLDRVIDATTLSDADPYAANSADDPLRVVPGAAKVAEHDQVARLRLPAVSWTAIQLGPADR